MIEEITSAVNFISNLLRTREVPADILEDFCTELDSRLNERYEKHWFPEHPCRGNGFRCMRINILNMDPIILQSAIAAGIPRNRLQKLLPSELTIWVDPFEVSYRIGEDGSICTLFDSESSSRSSSTCSSPTSDIDNHYIIQDCKTQMRSRKRVDYNFNGPIEVK
ncbi:protein BTG2-like [Anneissia japonica]|uniref:protein BTG2-like n=1 Tax=Anneissia japonica TaxID=1529436 RepID=UPI001425B892|nr:protein BTG2-like [Anneissia japonica]